MRASWTQIRAAMKQAIERRESKREFQKLRRHHPELSPFPCAAQLVAHLHDPAGDRDGKDAIYGALVRAAQEGAQVAVLVLWLGLWPGLNGVFIRQRRRKTGPAYEVVSNLADAFTSLVRGLRPGRVRRVAGTLVRSAERTLWGEFGRAQRESARRRPMPKRDRPAQIPEEPEPSRLGLTGCETEDEELAAIRRELVSVVGADADLVIGAAIYGESQRELGARLGLSHAAARKRYQRSLTRLRRHFSRRPCPTSGGRPRSDVEGERA